MRTAIEENPLGKVSRKKTSRASLDTTGTEAGKALGESNASLNESNVSSPEFQDESDENAPAPELTGAAKEGFGLDLPEGALSEPSDPTSGAR